MTLQGIGGELPHRFDVEGVYALPRVNELVHESEAMGHQRIVVAISHVDQYGPVRLRDDEGATIGSLEIGDVDVREVQGLCKQGARDSFFLARQWPRLNGYA